MISESWLELSMLSAGSDMITVLQKMLYYSFAAATNFSFTGMRSNSVSVPPFIYY